MKKMWAIFGGALGLYVVIVMLIAVGPAIDLAQTPPGPGVVPLTPLQEEGRQVFASNGCDYCHTEQVRPLPEDKVFGRPSAPGDFAYTTPEMLGSERTGPDLTNVGNAKPSDVWQYIHLYDPRAVEPNSIMPNFKFLFRVVDQVPDGDTAVPVPPAFAPKHGYVIPTQKAKALVAYLLSLKQPPIPGYSMNGGMGGPTSASPSSSAPASSAATGGYTFDPAKGKSLFEANCSACHQSSGEGIPTAFPPLVKNPAVLADDPTLQIDTILHGAHGKVIDGQKWSGTMTAFASQLNDAEIADIANHERTSWGNHAKEVTPAEVAAIRAGKTPAAASSAPAASASAPAASAPASSGATAAAGGYTFDAAKGKALFTQNCSACHQATGEGIPSVFPPLKGNAAVDNPDPTLHIHTVLHGASGVTIGGVKYPGAMTAFANQLNDTEIANIINYERSSWGNHAKPVTPAEVAAVRAKGN